MAKKMFEKAEEHIKQQQEQFNKSNTSNTFNNQEIPKEKKKVGEYIDYEEIE